MSRKSILTGHGLRHIKVHLRVFSYAPGDLAGRDNHGRDAAAGLCPMAGEIEVLYRANDAWALRPQLLRGHFPAKHRSLMVVGVTIRSERRRAQLDFDLFAKAWHQGFKIL